MYGYIETWGTGGASFRNLYKSFLKELLTHPELEEGSKAWTKDEFKMIEDSIPLIEDSAKNWTSIAETLNHAAVEFKDDCLSKVNLHELQNLALTILSKEEQLFKKLSKIRN
jgi:hypothetical protein